MPQAAGTEIRTESEVMSRGGRQEQESDTVKKLVQKESDIKAWLVPAETEVASLKKEIERLVTAHMHVVDVLDENAVKRVEEDNEDTSRQGGLLSLNAEETENRRRGVSPSGYDQKFRPPCQFC